MARLSTHTSPSLTRSLVWSVITILLALMDAPHALAHELTTKPEAVGLSSVRVERIARMVQNSVDRGELAGAVTLVARHGQVVWLQANGQQEREHAKPMRIDSIFRSYGKTQLISRKSVELMTHDQFGPPFPEQAFGLGFDGVKTPLHELGSAGQYQWGGFFYTGFTIDPQEDMITVFMAQLHPGAPNTQGKFHTQAYAALEEQAQETS